MFCGSFDAILIDTALATSGDECECGPCGPFGAPPAATPWLPSRLIYDIAALPSKGTGEIGCGEIEVVPRRGGKKR